MKLFKLTSIRFTIFLIYALILFAAFSLFGGFVYFYSEYEAYNKVDALLDVSAKGVEDSIRTYLKTREAGTVKVPSGWNWLFSRFENKEELPFSSIARLLTETRLVEEEDRIRIFIDIFDADGTLIASSSTPPPIKALSPEVLRQARKGERSYYTYSPPGAQKSGERAKTRGLLQPLIDKGQTLYLIQARTSLRAIQWRLARVGRFLIGLVLATLFVSSWAAIILVKITLLPVKKMVKKIRDIRADNLSERLIVPNTDDEIDDLARTFNEMLSRVEKSFVTQTHVIQDLSHELKTPLTIMQGQIDVALKKPRTSEEYESVLLSGLEEIAKIRRIINDLLMLARLDSRVAALELKPVNLTAVVRSVLDDSRMLAEEKKISTDLTGPEKVEIEANDIHLRRLFSNLLDNAVKYTPEGGNIHIRVETKSRGVWVEVQDTGIGIHANQLPHVFDRFYRAENRRPGDSYGLGLSICKSIVEAHKGEIRLSSQPGKGTTFRIFFHQRPPLPFFASA